MLGSSSSGDVAITWFHALTMAAAWRSLQVDQIQAFDFVAVVNTVGQLHEQLRNNPS